jgi:hypothetical protein
MVILLLATTHGFAEEAGGAAAEAVTSALTVERTMLEEDLLRHADASRRRSAADARLEQVRQSLEATLRDRQSAGAAERLERALVESDQAETERDGLYTAERALLERIRDGLRRIALLEQELDRLQGQRAQHQLGVLSGTWNLTLMPLEQRGSAILRQEGTLVNGTYQLEGGWSGSLQGTLVNLKVLLHRIDSRLGKSMELEGYLSSDGRVIRGTWLNYELAGGAGATGQWIAERRPVPASAGGSEQ